MRWTELFQFASDVINKVVENAEATKIVEDGFEIMLQKVEAMVTGEQFSNKKTTTQKRLFNGPLAISARGCGKGGKEKNKGKVNGRSCHGYGKVGDKMIKEIVQYSMIGKDICFNFSIVYF